MRNLKKAVKQHAMGTSFQYISFKNLYILLVPILHLHLDHMMVNGAKLW